MPTIEQLGLEKGDKVQVPYQGKYRVCEIVAMKDSGVYIFPPLSDNNGLNLAIYNHETEELRSCYEGIIIEGYKVQGRAFPERDEVYVQRIPDKYAGFKKVDQTLRGRFRAFFQINSYLIK